MLLLAARTASAQYTRLSADGLAGVGDAMARLLPAGKLVFCAGEPVIVEIRESVSATIHKAANGGRSWSHAPIVTAAECPTSNTPAPLIARDQSYMVGVTPHNVTGEDRIIVIGGGLDTNVYYSDDCGATFSCYDGVQPWDARGDAALFSVPGTPGVWMAGGLVVIGLTSVFSVGVFTSSDAGMSWSRPVCAHPPCQNSFDPPTGPPVWVMPVVPILWDQLASDEADTNAWDFDYGGGTMFRLNATTTAAGFDVIQGAGGGGASAGRKVYLRGQQSGGCWVATDGTTYDLLFAPNYTASNAVAIALTAEGPWVGIGPAPWLPRGGAAFVASPDHRAAIFAGGLPWVALSPQGPPFGDVWRVDASACLVSPDSGAVCDGHGVANLATVTCACEPNYFGRVCDHRVEE